MLLSRVAWLGLLCVGFGAGCGDAASEVGGLGTGGFGDEAAAGGSGGSASAATISFSVTLMDETGLLADRPVMYADADGKHFSTTLSSSGGVARFTNVPAAGFVTAQFEDGGHRLSLQTVAGIEDGDAIGLTPARAYELPLTPPMGRTAISVSSLPENAERYLIYHAHGFSNYMTGAPLTTEFPFSLSVLGPSGRYNALGVAELADDEVAFGLAPDLLLEGSIEDLVAEGSIESWEAPSGAVRAELRNLFEEELVAAVIVSGYRDTLPFYTRGNSDEIPSGVTMGTELPISASFHDQAIVTFVLDVFDGPVALANERFVSSRRIPDGGRTEVIWASTDGFLPNLSAASHDVAERSAAYHWAQPPLCDGVAANVSVLELGGSSQDKQYKWTMLSAYRDELRMPELDPEYAETWFPADLEERHWALEARAYPDGNFDSVRKSRPAFLPPRAWLARHPSGGTLCVARARTGGPR